MCVCVCAYTECAGKNGLYTYTHTRAHVYRFLVSAGGVCLSTIWTRIRYPTLCVVSVVYDDVVRLTKEKYHYVLFVWNILNFHRINAFFDKKRIIKNK